MHSQLRPTIRIVRRRYLSIIHWIVRALAILMIPFGLGISLVHAQNTEPPDQAPVTTAPDGINQENAETTTQEQNIPNLAIGVSNMTSDLPTGFALGLGGASTATLLALAGSTNAKGGQTTAPTSTSGQRQRSTTHEQAAPPLVALIPEQAPAAPQQAPAAPPPVTPPAPVAPPPVAPPAPVAPPPPVVPPGAPIGAGPLLLKILQALPWIGIAGASVSSLYMIAQTLEELEAQQEEYRIRQQQSMVSRLQAMQDRAEQGNQAIGSLGVLRQTFAQMQADARNGIFYNAHEVEWLLQQAVETSTWFQANFAHLNRVEEYAFTRFNESDAEAIAQDIALWQSRYTQAAEWQQEAQQFVYSVLEGSFSNSQAAHDQGINRLETIASYNTQLENWGIAPIWNQAYHDQLRDRMEAGRYYAQINHYLRQAEAGEAVDIDMFEQLTNNALYYSNQMETRQQGTGFYPEDVRNTHLEWMRDLQQQREYVSQINDSIARAEAGEVIDYQEFEQLTNNALYLSNQMETRWPGTGFYSEEARKAHLEWLANIQNGDRTQEEDTFIVGPDGTVYSPDDPVPDNQEPDTDDDDSGQTPPPPRPPTTTGGNDEEEEFRRELEQLRNEIQRLQELANQSTRGMNASQRQDLFAQISNKSTAIRHQINAIKSRVSQSQNLTEAVKERLLEELNLLYNRAGTIEYSFFTGQSLWQKMREFATDIRITATLTTAVTGVIAYLTLRNNQQNEESLEIQRITEERLSTLPLQALIALQQAEVSLRLQMEANERALVMAQRTELLEDYRLRLEEYNEDRERYQDESQAYANAQAAYNAAVQQYNTDLAAYNVAVQQRQTWRDQRTDYNNYVDSSTGKTRIARLLEDGEEWTFGDPLDGYALPEGPEPTVPVEPQAPIQNLPPQPLPPTVQRPAVPTLPELPESTGIPDPELLRISRESNLEELEEIVQRHRELLIQLLDEAAELEEPLPPEVQEQLDQQNPPPQPQSYQSPPIPTTPIASSPQTIIYTVQPGDTLDTIAQRFYGEENTVAQNIAQLNALEDSEILQTGQEVQVPVYN